VQLEKGKISNIQFTLLIILFGVSSGVLIIASTVGSIAGKDSWIAVLLSFIPSILIIWLVHLLGRRFPERNLIELTEIIAGKWFGKLISLIFILYFLLLASLILREVGEFVVTTILPGTPLEVVHITFIVVVVYTLRKGSEVFARSSEIFFPYVLLFLLLIFLLLFPHFELNNIRPILADGIMPVLSGTIPVLWYSFFEMIIFLMIYPYVQEKKNRARSLFIGTIVISFVFFITVLGSTLVMGENIMVRSTYPGFGLARQIRIGDFFQRVELMIIGVWLLSMYFKVLICFYATALGTAQWLRLSNYRLLLIPLAILILGIATWSTNNTAEFGMFIQKRWTFIAGSIGVLLPIFLLITAVVRKLDERKGGVRK
jgi:spore germination protein KB